MKKIFQLLLFTIILSLIACEHKTQPDFNILSNYKQKEITINIIQKADSIPTLDTTIVIKKQVSKKERSAFVTENLVKNALYQYYSKKKFCIEGKVPKGKSKLDGNLICIGFDTAYLVNLNCDNNLDAIVAYWVMPYGGSSHCYLPKRTILLNSGRGFILQNEGFIEDFYLIDSVTQVNNCSVALYGNEWDCGGTDEIIRKFKVTLK